MHVSVLRNEVAGSVQFSRLMRRLASLPAAQMISLKLPMAGVVCSAKRARSREINIGDRKSRLMSDQIMYDTFSEGKRNTRYYIIIVQMIFSIRLAAVTL